MKRYLILFLLLTFAWTLSAREVYNINRGWSFFSASEDASDNSTKVDLPHIWNQDALSGKKDYYRGIGNYLKKIHVPADWNTRKVFIRLHGASSVVNIFINGKHAGEHRGGYLQFSFDITRFLSFGSDNSILIVVNNSPRFDVLPTAGEANVYGGIFRDVELLVTNSTCIAPSNTADVAITQQKVSQDSAEGVATVKINSTREKTVVVHLAIYTDKGDTVSKSSIRTKVSEKNPTTSSIQFKIDKPTLWNGTINPFLYNVSVKVMEGDSICDQIVTKTGFRSISVDNERGLLLNGEPYPVKGVVVSQDRAMVGPALLSYHIEEDISLILNMGANAVRVAGVPHHPDFYNLCDKAGILVWSELPFLGSSNFTEKPFMPTSAFMENGRQQLKEIMGQQYNHPSIVMWGIFSDLNLRNDDPLKYIKELNKIAKDTDPSRPTVANSNQDGEINFITDLIIWNQRLGWYEGMPSDITIWLDQLSGNWKHLRSGLSYGAGASISHQDEESVRPKVASNWHPERWQTYLHEVYIKGTYLKRPLWGVFVCNMFEYGAASDNWGEGNGLNDLGLVTFDRKYYKDAYFLYKANWNTTDKFIHITEKRLNNRTNAEQAIKVFTNSDQEVELHINGKPFGVKQHPVGGVVKWDKITLQHGHNTIEVSSADLSDRATITISSKTSSLIPKTL